MKSTNIWYGPQGGCYDFPRNANDIPIYTGRQQQRDAGGVPSLPVRSSAAARRR